MDATTATSTALVGQLSPAPSPQKPPATVHNAQPDLFDGFKTIEKTDQLVKEAYFVKGKKVGYSHIEFDLSNRRIKILQLVAADPKHYRPIIERIVHRSFKMQLGSPIAYEAPQEQAIDLLPLGFSTPIKLQTEEELQQLQDKGVDAEQLIKEQVETVFKNGKVACELVALARPIWKKILNAKTDIQREVLFIELQKLQEGLLDLYAKIVEATGVAPILEKMFADGKFSES